MENKTVVTVSELVDLLKEKPMRILLIGVTIGGRNLFCEFKKNSLEENIAFWTDEKYNFYRKCGIPVENPDSVSHHNYDLVILAGKRADKFAQKLIKSNSLSSLPLYMVDEKNIGEADFEWKNMKYTDEPVSDDELIEMNPRDLLNEKRMGFIIRYLAAEEILKDVDGDGLDLYRKYMYYINGQEEYIKPFTTCAYFSDYEEKKGADSFIASFKKLLCSVKENGFDKKHFIPVSETMSLLNGAHRLIAALIFDNKVWIKKYVGFGEPFIIFGVEDLKKLDCTQEQIQLVKDTYKKLKGTDNIS